jgi:hypothetical protein
MWRDNGRIQVCTLKQVHQGFSWNHSPLPGGLLIGIAPRNLIHSLRLSMKLFNRIIPTWIHFQRIPMILHTGRLSFLRI